VGIGGPWHGSLQVVATSEPDLAAPSPAIEVAEPTKRCSTCAEDIRADAKKCVKCSAYQDGRRFLVGSPAFVSVIAAVVSVSAAVGPSIHSLSLQKKAEPEIDLIGASPGFLKVSVRNTGTEPIYVDGATLSYGKGRVDISRPLTMLPGAGVPVPGLGTAQVLFTASVDLGPFTNVDDYCAIWLGYGGPGNRYDIATSRVNCARLANFSLRLLPKEPVGTTGRNGS
jgi:hypothetical protein